MNVCLLSVYGPVPSFNYAAPKKWKNLLIEKNWVVKPFVWNQVLYSWVLIKGIFRSSWMEQFFYNVIFPYGDSTIRKYHEIGNYCVLKIPDWEWEDWDWLQRRLSVFRKLCLNLWSRIWLSFTPPGLRQPKRLFTAVYMSLKIFNLKMLMLWVSNV